VSFLLLLYNKIVSVAKENAHLMEQKSGRESSLSDEETTNYLNRVINELKQKEAEVVGSNPTRSTSFLLYNYGIGLNSI
jgi:hypothetical protein